MSSVRALAERVRRLEAACTAPKSPIEAVFGSFEAFADNVRSDVGAGRLVATDMLGSNGNGGVLRALQVWHQQQLWGAWHRNRMWEYGG